MRWLVDEAFPEAERVRVVLENLNLNSITKCNFELGER